MAKITVRFQGKSLGEFPLEPGFNSIGRLPANHICIENLGVSRQHAFILCDIKETVYILEDLGSLNGTYVNKKRAYKWLLNPNDVITIGQHALEFLPGEFRADEKETEDMETPRKNEPCLEEISTGKRYYLVKDTTFLGNSSADDIYIPGLMVGKQFASIQRKGQSWLINILVPRFSNLKVNGAEVRNSKLQDGDILVIGDLEFHLSLPGNSIGRLEH